jgi:hypothetical protein
MKWLLGVAAQVGDIYFRLKLIVRYRSRRGPGSTGS